MTRIIMLAIFILGWNDLAHAGHFDAEFAAQKTAQLLNETENFDQWIERVSPVLTHEEIEGIKLFVKSTKSNSVKAEATGNKVKFNGETMEFLKDGTIQVNGLVFRKHTIGKFDSSLKEALDRLSPKQSLFDLVVPPARAEFGGLAKMVFRAMFIGTGLLAVAGTLAVAYVVPEIYANLQQGKISCNGKYFVFKVKSRSMIGAFDIWCP